MSAVLVAGIGNMLDGDGGWGCEVVRRLSQKELPAGVHVVDFGTRNVELAYSLLDEFPTAVLIGSVERGGTPGDVRLTEPEPPTGMIVRDDLILRDLDPAQLLRFVRALDGTCERLLLVSCEPQRGGAPAGETGLSDPVERAVERGVDMVRRALERLLDPTPTEADARSGQAPHDKPREAPHLTLETAVPRSN